MVPRWSTPIAWIVPGPPSKQYIERRPGRHPMPLEIATPPSTSFNPLIRGTDTGPHPLDSKDGVGPALLEHGQGMTMPDDPSISSNLHRSNHGAIAANAVALRDRHLAVVGRRFKEPSLAVPTQYGSSRTSSRRHDSPK